MPDLVNWARVEVERYRNPIRWELVRHVLPAFFTGAAIGAGFGYWWAWSAMRLWIAGQ